MYQNHKNENLNNTQQSKVLKVKNSPFELEKDLKPINISVGDMNKLEKRTNKEENVCKTTLDTIGMIGQLTIFLGF